ncbi:MAG: D-2-hydroxyacid dehydrogenase [Moraxella sp.]|uniref:D-2-hydroxyacid dehydrogenase n=1 Tax=Moraxella sp. TaxID=479 RepID=UPI0026DB5D48|nr:D-2-hydroxyacid dehydrogenase [Moraxella sp.]MDO4450871.1 D-2-hydroxyacid dehydrogenase [Moraxella sp.]
MKAVFLDRNTFLSSLTMPTPNGVSEYQVFESTPQDDDVIVARCEGADIIIVNKVVIGRVVIERLPNLKLIQLTATGMNNIDLVACEECGVAVQNVAGYSTDSVPEHTFMLMLTAMRAGRHYHTQATDGTWQADGKFCLLDTPILDLAGRTLGIVGRGAIGQKVGQIATAFGMTVLYADRAGATPREGYTAFDEVLACANVISLHCPLTDDTHHLINDDTISKMGKKPLIINVARGDVVDSHAIVRGLLEGKILGYASDVFPQEPPTDDEPLLALKDHPRVFFTPHNAWGSENAQSRLWAILCQRVSGFIKDKSL